MCELSFFCPGKHLLELVPARQGVASHRSSSGEELVAEQVFLQVSKHVQVNFIEVADWLSLAKPFVIDELFVQHSF